MANNSVKKEHLVQILKFELAKRVFWEFCLHYDKEFFESRPFLKEIADGLQEIADGKIKSLSASLPPRAGKSYITSLFCGWMIGNNPTESIMRNTCTATLYLKFSYDVRQIVKSEKFNDIFPRVRLSDDKANLQGWNTNQSKQVGYFGAGVGGTIIGFGASKVAITDDLYRGIEDALSDTVNDRIHQWKESTHDSRFETGCARVDIGTRWSINDVIGRNMEQNVYEKSIMVSAMDENDETFCTAVMSTDEYIEKRKRTANEIWLAEYQQQPVDSKGRLFSDLRYMEKDEFDEFIRLNTKADGTSPIDGCMAYIDVSDQGADYTSMAVCALIKNQLFLVDYVFTRANTDVSIPLCAGMLNKWGAKYVRVESNSMGAMFSRQLQLHTKTKVLQVNNTTNKITRIIMNSAFIQNSMMFIKTGTNECEQFIQNVLSFSKEGKNKNDDAPDCLAGLAIFVQSMFKI